tara:strand:+ start:147 stop:488 length:342 start_codon:yes stop_codon:yes gene_type:complete
MALIDKFNKTNLDLENPKPSGGPNRTNSKNIPSGQYDNLKSSNPNGFTFQNQSPGGALKDLNGKTVYTQLHQYTPNNTYLDSIIGTPNTVIQPPPPTPPPTPPTPPISNNPTI